MKGHNSGTDFGKMTCKNPKLDITKMNAHIKFCENISSSLQDIKWKQNLGINQRAIPLRQIFEKLCVTIPRQIVPR